MAGGPAIRRLILVAATFLTLACGDGSGAVPSAAPSPAQVPADVNLASLNACTLVSRAMAGQLVGAALSQSSQTANSASSDCVYKSQSGNESVAIFVQQAPGGDATKVVQAALDPKGPAASRLTRGIDGIGDAAGGRFGANDAAVVFARGKLLVVLSATAAGTKGADLLPKVEALASQVAARF
ncbi:MAG: hypothetical protein M3Z98_05450 [Candidatus Dormibacteraeota bacterium]|nr:hypothetical protein [Candidatus Dormibacteraeota bacterium]